LCSYVAEMTAQPHGSLTNFLPGLA
jgi:hypothetical protein